MGNLVSIVKNQQIILAISYLLSFLDLIINTNMRSGHLRRSKTPSKNYKYEQLQTVRLIAKVPATGIRFINGVSN